jgi:TrmH family RNA methyltransferase
MEPIVSPTNPKIKKWQKLYTRKGRDAQRAYLIEGVHLLEEALRTGARFEAVVLREGEELPAAWREELEERGVPCYVVPDAIFRRLAATQHPQGVVAVLRIEEPRKPLEKRLHEPRLTGLLVDAVQDPGNLGTILRTADAFGVDFVLLGKGTVDLYNDKVVRSSMGSLFRVPVYHGALETWIESMQRAGVCVVASQLGAKERLDRCLFPARTVFLVGNEAQGVSPQLCQRADVCLQIPMGGEAESLNVATAAAVLLYERFRQLYSVGGKV